jgi:hypothetical protein
LSRAGAYSEEGPVQSPLTEPWRQPQRTAAPPKGSRPARALSRSCAERRMIPSWRRFAGPRRAVSVRARAQETHELVGVETSGSLRRLRRA